jgi:hypothetical protein
VSYLILWLRKNDHLFLPHYLAVILLLASGAAFIHFRGVPTYQVKAIKVVVKSDSTRLARGEHKKSIQPIGRCFRRNGALAKGLQLVAEILKLFFNIYALQAG